MLVPGAEAAAPSPPAGLPARAWVLVDADDGEVLAAHRASSSYSIASTTKLMTAYVARRELGLHEVVVAPPYQALAAESLLGLEAGERIEVRDLLYGLLLVSGNDAAEALAQAAAGSEDAFVAEMNRAASKLGLDDTSYANPIGLDEAGNYSSAEDLVELAIELRRDKLFRRIFDTPEAVTETGARPRQLVNRNVLVRTVPDVNGVKTGYTIDAGNVLVGSAEREGVELVSAVLGAPSESERDSATMSLLDYGFSLYHRRSPVKAGRPLAAVAIRDREAEVPAARRPATLRVTVRRGQRVETVGAGPARGRRAGRAGRAPRPGRGLDRRRADRPGAPGGDPRGGRGEPARTLRRGGPRARARWPGAWRSPALTLLFIAAIAIWDRRR